MSARILYVEDDAFVAKAAARRLRREGYDVTVSGDGDAGLDIALRGDFDVVLLDHKLPGKSGIEILKHMRQGSAPPTIMVSGSAELSVAVEALRLGAADFVIKETDGSYLDLLPRTVNRVLDHARLVAEKAHADRRIAQQAAIIQGVLDNMDPAVTLFDAELGLAAFNDRLLVLFDLPRDLVAIGVPMHEMLEHMARTGEFGDGDIDTAVNERIALFRAGQSFRIDHARPNGRVVEIRGGPMPGGGYIATYTDITDRKRMEEDLRRLATTDPLTGVNNRRRFNEIAEREFHRCRRYGHPLCAIMIDADRFKGINDNHGHDIGDEVLKALARACARELRDVDVFGRHGGEEFTAALPETTLATALDAAERLRAAASRVRVPLEDGSHLSFTVSIGVADLDSRDQSIGDVLGRADKALYEAKESGRNRVVAKAAAGDEAETA